MRKSPARVWARPRGKYWRALGSANLARYHSFVGAVALGGKPVTREQAINILTEQIGLFESVLRRYGGR